MRAGNEEEKKKDSANEERWEGIKVEKAKNKVGEIKINKYT